jgi:hypothetical protein
MNCPAVGGVSQLLDYFHVFIAHVKVSRLTNMLIIDTIITTWVI